VKQLISNLKKHNPDLKEAEIIGLLYIINSKENLTNNTLVKMTGVPKPILKTFKSSIANLLKETEEDNIELSEEGLGVLSQLDLVPYRWSLLKYDLKEFEDKISHIREKHQLNPDRKLDQFFAVPETTVSKAKILKDKGMIEGKKIALLGDDDLVSISLGLMYPLFAEVKVFELDEKIIKEIKKIAREKGMKGIETELYDVRNALPDKAAGTFDAVLIDPPYTQTGAKVFLHRAVELLKKRKDFSGSYILMNFGVGRKNPEMAIKMQEIINQYNLVIEDKINKFSRYEGAETVGNASSLYILKTTSKTSIEGKVLPEVIYTYEKTKLQAFPYVDHLVFKLQKVPDSITKSKTKLAQKMGEFCKQHQLKVVDTKITKFKKQGYSLTYILATSNLILHTWPESNSLHLDLITCSPIYNKELLSQTLQKLFETDRLEIRQID
jgi:predicted methyltransferase